MSPLPQDTQPNLGTVLIELKNICEDIAEIKRSQEYVERTLRGNNGDPGIVGRVNVLEKQVATALWVGAIVLGTLVTIVIYHVVTVP